MLALGSAVASVALVAGACTQASGGNPVKIPTFDTPAGSATVPLTETSTWTPTWQASIPAPVVKPTTPPPPKPPKPPVVTTTKEPTFTIPTVPGVPFVREGARCSSEGAVGISRTGEPLVCTRSRGDQLRWRRA